MILTAGDNSIKYFNSLQGRSPFYAIAEERYISELENVGYIFTEEPNEVKFVIVTLDRNYTEEKFQIAKNAINKGAELFAVNVDNTCPVAEGEIIDAGKIINRLEDETGIKLQKHFGKPSEFMIREILQKMEAGKNYLLIGDRLETDIKMGNLLGIDTALVKSGILNDLDFIDVKPTYVLSSVNDLAV
jgi:arabinose operon protein AraL